MLGLLLPFQLNNSVGQEMHDQTEFHLKLVINFRCGAVPSYTLDSQLRDTWFTVGIQVTY